LDSEGVIEAVFGVPRALIGVLHLDALPGTPNGGNTIDAIVQRAVAEGRVLHEVGFHGLLIENMHDRPYLKRVVGPEVTASMAVVGREVRNRVPLPLGVQILAGANREALAVAQAAGAEFVRVEGFAFAHIADEGLIESDAGELLRYRVAIAAENIAVFADIKKKHSAHTLTSDIDLVETARAAEFFLADGVVVTGTSTGRATDINDVDAVSQAVSVPTLVGSGITPENMAEYASADALIVGSSLKSGGLWSNPLEPRRAMLLAEAFATASQTN